MEKKGFQLNEKAGYFKNFGVDVMGFDDYYPEGHQSGVSILMHGDRVATNGDIRFEPTPGQWQPVPMKMDRTVDVEKNTIETNLHYPDLDRHLVGFNPMIYPDIELDYKVRIEGAGDDIIVTVDFDKPIPDEFVGKICFNMELFPGTLVGKNYLMDDKAGVFPTQANGPTYARRPVYELSKNYPMPDNGIPREKLSGGNKGYNPIIADDILAVPYATGHTFVLTPEDPYKRVTIKSETEEIALYDGRMNHNNGWFALSSLVPAGATEGAVRWIITPNVEEDWLYTPVLQHSQVGYHPKQEKIIIAEMDARDTREGEAVLYKLTAVGEKEVARKNGVVWGNFLRYRYIKFDFSEITEEGLYCVGFCGAKSTWFRIAEDVYDRGVWQPVLEYFLPIQMCHMRVNEKYRVWHDRCHMDDANFAKIGMNLFDGYTQGKSSMTKYGSGDHVPGLNKGGWHDAGDFDLRVESQAGESYILSLAYEAFDVNLDATTVDQDTQTVEIHQPDGKNDILQQIEHGMLSVLGSYKALGRLYRGIICNDLRQYVLLGDAAAMTDGIPGNEDDRWVFTEDNPTREFSTAAQIAASAKALKGFNDTLSKEGFDAAAELFEITEVRDDRARCEKIHAACELFLATGDEKYKAYILSETPFITEHIKNVGWYVARVIKTVDDADFTEAVKGSLLPLQEEYEALSAETPYGIPYRPNIWGAGWDIQRLGFQYYFLYKAFPEVFPKEFILNALNFVLGCHPGKNDASFASGVGTKSATTAYGINRADWSFLPGGVISGTALIRPDFPELLVFPFLWQQTEYVLGGGSSHYMFLALAAKEIVENL